MPETITGRTATRVKQDFFDEIQLDAGILVKGSVTTRAGIKDSDIITATTGGIQVACTPTYSDLFEDVDNVPTNTKEGLHLDGWQCTMSTTALSNSVDTIKFALGVADNTGTTVSPRSVIKSTDFADLTWLGDLADGRLAAIVLKNALSTGGYSLQTTKNGKGQISMTLTGYISLTDPTAIPMEFYIIEAAGG